MIVDDCSSDTTRERLTALVAQASFPIVPLRTARNSGPAAARNLGWRASRAPVVAFTDDDCRPDSKWLARMTEALEQADIVQGPTLLDPDEAAGRGPFARTQWVTSWSGQFDCCNIGYRREVLERCGGFEERFRRAFGEDTDLGWRAVERGATTAWEPEAVVRHGVETTGDRLRDWVVWVNDTRRRVYAPLIVRRHPGLRATLHRRWFYKPHHPRTLLALAGLAAVALKPGRGRRWLAAGACALPWVQYRIVVNPRPARRRNLPVVLALTFVGDGTEVGVMLVGSARFRTLLL